jgi:hypothetical protein
MSSIYTLNTPLVVKNNMQVDGTCTFLNPVNFGNQINIGSSGSIAYSPTGLIFNSDLIPSTDTLSIGTINNPWKSIYISTGTVFIGPTGALQINNNGLISSLEGFAAPYFQVGATNPGAGILLTEQNNLLYFQNQIGVVGPVSVFNSSIINPNDTYYSLTGNVGFGVTGPQQKIDVLGNIQASNTVFATNFTGTNMHISSIEANNSTLNNFTGTNGTVTNLTATTFTGTTMYTSNLIASNTVSANLFTGANVSTNKVTFDGVGSIYFQTGSATGCFITGLNYNTTGTEHYVYYNNTTKELSQSSPNYFYSYSTGTQQILAASTTTTANFQPVTFNVNNILYHTFKHSFGSSVFTGTFASAVTLQFSYSLQMHSTINPNSTAAAILNMDGSPIAGSYRSCTISNNTGEFPLNNTFLVNVPQGSHWFELQVAGTSTTIYVGGYHGPNVPNIFPPGNSYTSANLCCTRVI